MATPMTMSPQAQQQNPNINAWDLALLKAQNDALAQYPLLASTNPALSRGQSQSGSTPNLSAISNLFKSGGPSGAADAMPAYNTLGAVDAAGSADISAGSADAAASMSGALGGEAATGSILGADAAGGAAGAAGLGAAGTMGMAAMPLLAVLFASYLDKGKLPWDNSGERDPMQGFTPTPLGTNVTGR